MFLCGASLNGVPCCNHLACPCGVLLWSAINFQALCLCSIVFKWVFKVFWVQIPKGILWFQMLSRKDGEALQKFSDFDTGSTFSAAFL